MNKHFAWRPHLDRNSLFNPYVPSERKPELEHIDITEAGEEAQGESDTTSTVEKPPVEGKEPQGSSK